jgi:ribosomal protein L34
MGYQDSFTKLEREIQHGFRQRMQQAETCDDTKHFFAQTVEGLLTQVFGEDAGIRVEDVTLVPEKEPFYVISDRLMRTAGFRKEWEASDLRHVIARLAGTAAHHCTHMSRQDWRTTARARIW